tara:strand:+ start:1701 stop:2189 length:489 start_codon:yes stop_codon:yes gene_type:complete
MLESNYGLGFYLIETNDNNYDLYNSVTDKCILMEQPKDKIVKFLELNLPNHPFLHQIDQESGSYTYSYTAGNNSFEKIGNAFYASVPLGEDMDLANYNSYYSSFDYSNADYCSGLSDEDIDREDYPEQLEFEFTYRGNEDRLTEKTLRDIEEDIPYLGDNED